MSKKVKIILIVAAVAVIAGLSVYFFYWKPKQDAEKKEAEKKAADKTTVKTDSSTSSAPVTGVSGTTGIVKEDVRQRTFNEAQEITIIS